MIAPTFPYTKKRNGIYISHFAFLFNKLRKLEPGDGSNDLPAGRPLLSFRVRKEREKEDTVLFFLRPIHMLLYGGEGFFADDVLDAAGILGGGVFIHTYGGKHFGKHGMA